MTIKVWNGLHEALKLDHIGVLTWIRLLAETLEKFQRFATFIISFQGWDIFKQLSNRLIDHEKKKGFPTGQIPYNVLIGG